MGKLKANLLLGELYDLVLNIGKAAFLPWLKKRWVVRRIWFPCFLILGFWWKSRKFLKRQFLLLLLYILILTSFWYFGLNYSMLFGKAQGYLLTNLSKTLWKVLTKIWCKLLLYICNRINCFHNQSVVVLTFVVLKKYLPGW